MARSDTDLTSAHAGIPGTSESSRVADLVMRAMICVPPISIDMRSEFASSPAIAVTTPLRLFRTERC